MHRIDYPAIAEWCDQSGYELRDWIPSLPSVAKSLECSPSLQQLPEFLDALVSLEADERLIWIADWTIWNDRSQDIGLRHLAMLTGAEPSEEDDRALAFVLEPGQWREAIAILTVPVLYGWDAHLLFRSGLLLADISHHGTVAVSLRRDDDRLDRWARKSP